MASWPCATFPDSSIVFDHLETATIEVELPNYGGFIKVEVRYADIVGFTVLKILAFRNSDRSQGRARPDLQPGKFRAINRGDRRPFYGRAAGQAFRGHQPCLGPLADSFADEKGRDGYEKHGPGSGRLV